MSVHVSQIYTVTDPKINMSPKCSVEPPRHTTYLLRCPPNQWLPAWSKLGPAASSNICIIFDFPPTGLNMPSFQGHLILSLYCPLCPYIIMYIIKYIIMSFIMNIIMHIIMHMYMYMLYINMSIRTYTCCILLHGIHRRRITYLYPITTECFHL